MCVVGLFVLVFCLLVFVGFCGVLFGWLGFFWFFLFVWFGFVSFWFWLFFNLNLDSVLKTSIKWPHAFLLGRTRAEGHLMT